MLCVCVWVRDITNSEIKVYTFFVLSCYLNYTEKTANMCFCMLLAYNYQGYMGINGSQLEKNEKEYSRNVAAIKFIGVKQLV